MQLKGEQATRKSGKVNVVAIEASSLHTRGEQANDEANTGRVEETERVGSTTGSVASKHQHEYRRRNCRQEEEVEGEWEELQVDSDVHVQQMQVVRRMGQEATGVVHFQAQITGE